MTGASRGFEATIPRCQAGKAAKVRALIVHICPTNWRGPGRDLDWDISEPRRLLSEFAGMTEEELAAI